MSGMTEEKQEECLEKILTGEIKGTVQAIHQLKSSPNIESEEELPEEEITEDIDEIEESTIENVEIETESEIESETSEEEDTNSNEEVEESAEIVNPFLNVGQKLKKSVTLEIIDVPEEFEDPQKEAEEWYAQEMLKASEKLLKAARLFRDEEDNELKASQWGMRVSVAGGGTAKMKLQTAK